MASFPDSVPALTNPTEFDQTNSTGVPHWQQHANANDEIEAIAAFLLNGTGPSGGQEWRFKLVASVLQLQVKNPAGGGTPWHRVFPELQEGVLQLVIDPTGQAT